ncbi:MAG: helix-turn-helix domain-containing protein [Geobacteraceae bacterium]
MSIKLMSIVWMMDLPKAEKMLLLALADSANDDGVCWPSREVLAKKCGDSVRTVIRSIVKLEQRGFLVNKTRTRDNGSYRSNIYQLQINDKMSLNAPEPKNINDKMSLNLEADSPINDKMSSINDKMSPLEPKRTNIPKGSVKQKLTPSTDHQYFVAWWQHSYQRITGSAFVVLSKHYVMVAKLLKNIDLEEIISRACVYLTIPDDRRFPRGSPTIEGLVRCINDFGGKCTITVEESCFQLGILPDFNQNLRDFTPWRNNENRQLSHN